MVDRRPTNRFSLLVLVLHTWPSCSSQGVSSDHHPWSPIVRGRPILPPVIPAAVLQAGGGGSPVIPVRDLEEPDGTSAPSGGGGGGGGVRYPVRRYRRRYWRPIRRRRPPYLDYGPYNQYRRSYTVVPRRPEVVAATAPASGFRGSGYRQARGSSRVMVEEERGLMADLRSLFGAPEHCLEGGVQFSCTLAPVCWLTGGIVSEGTV